jgi:hypothetical protein
MAWVGREVDGNDRDNFAVGDRGSHTIERDAFAYGAYLSLKKMGKNFYVLVQRRLPRPTQSNNGMHPTPRHEAAHDS